jgi:glycosyltransferase involved in cell wall biosynthesis
MKYSIVIPTVGRPSLRRLLAALVTAEGPAPGQVVVVDDRPEPGLVDITVAPSGTLILATGGSGPAAARNLGWRAVDSEWVVFLDDDVLPTPAWPRRLAADLEGLPDDVAGSQGRIQVPLPADRRPTDWERSTAALESARWATADMAYRRRVLAELGGFDQRFPRAYREDAELALRVFGAGYQLVRGRREVVHPVRSARFFASLRAQEGNADDALMRRLHGPAWRHRAQAPRGRFTRHLLTTGVGALAVAAAAARVGRVPGARPIMIAAAAGWLAGVAEFAAARVLPGPGSRSELARMVVTSVLIPPAAVWHRLRGELAARHAQPLGESA